MYLLTSYLGKSFFLTYPLFALADIRVAKTIYETGEFQLRNSFEDSNSPKKYWTTLLLYFIKNLLLIANIIIFFGIGFGLVYAGSKIDILIDLDIYYFGIFFFCIGILAFVVSTTLIYLYLGPTLYLIQSKDNIGISETLSGSISTMKKNGKMKLFLIYFIHFLLFVIITGILFLLLCLLNLYVSETILYLFLILFAYILLIVVAWLILSTKIATISLFKDLIK